jgi:plastocyanin
MNRRLTLAVAATAAIGLPALVFAPSSVAAKKNRITIKGDFVFRPGKSAFDNQRFTPRNTKVQSGSTVTLLNKSKAKQDPHTISFIERAFLPKSFDAPVAGPLFGLHQLSDDPSAPPVSKIDNGAPAADQAAPLEVDTLGTPDAPGDSELIAPGQKKTTFKVTADEGSTLYYFCIFHPWMQGKIGVK